MKINPKTKFWLMFSGVIVGSAVVVRLISSPEHSQSINQLIGLLWAFVIIWFYLTYKPIP